MRLLTVWLSAMYPPESWTMHKEMHKQTLIKIKAAEKAALIIIMEAFRPLGRGLGGGHFLLCVCAANIQEV